MSKTSDIQLIEKAFNALDHALESKGYDFQAYYKQSLAEERDHRKFMAFGAGLRNGLTTTQAAKLFCVRQIAEYLNGQQAPDPAEIFSYRLSIFQAYSLATRFRAQIEKAFAPFDINAILALDYAELNKAA